MSLVDVIIPVRNGADTIRSALNSILEQTFSDFRVIVVDDGSTDDTLTIVTGYECADARVTVIKGPGQGIAAALNLALDAGSSPYIARMDADDVAHPERLSSQVKEFDHRPNLVLLGTRIRWFGDKSGQPSMVTGAETCRLALSFFTPFCHPTVMMRRAAINKLDQPYDPAFEYSEDWDLFSRLSGIGEVDNLPGVHLDYRIHHKQVSQAQKGVQITQQRSIALRHQHDILGARSLSQKTFLLIRLLATVGIGNFRQVARAALRSAVGFRGAT